MEQRNLKKLAAALLSIALSVVAARVDRIIDRFEENQHRVEPLRTPPNKPHSKKRRKPNTQGARPSKKVPARQNCTENTLDRGVTAVGQGSATTQNSERQLTRIVRPDQTLKNSAPVTPLPNIISDNAAIASHQPFPIAISTPRPVYPRLAWDARIGGTVTILLGISSNGSVYEARGRGNPILLKAAKDAVTQWRYEPYTATEDGQLVWKEITVNFNR
jgi:TonB family protein